MKCAFVLSSIVFFAALTSSLPALAKDKGPQWIATWSASPAPSGGQAITVANQTLREIVHVTAGGNTVRIRLSNRFGVQPVTIDAAHIALRDSGCSIVDGSDRELTFSGRNSVVIPPAATVLSDPADLIVPEASDLAVSLFIAGSAAGTTGHFWQRNAVYVADGNQAAARSFPDSGQGSGLPWLWLRAVDVAGSSANGVVVAFGDSITDGAGTTRDKGNDWPTLLAARFKAAHKKLAVIDEGISGNRLLHDGGWPPFGINGLARFEDDALSQPSVTSVIVLLGINDIGQVGNTGNPPDKVSAEDIEAALTQLAERAHEHGLRIYVGTLTPFAVTTIKDYYSPEKDVERHAVNDWIRADTVFDGVVDFDKAVRDPAHPDQMLPADDSGDHLHPSDAGDQAMANAVDLRWFR